MIHGPEQQTGLSSTPNARPDAVTRREGSGGRHVDKTPDVALDSGRTPAHVALHHVTKRFGGAVALDDVSVDVLKGTVHGFVGENGAGKSTTGKIIAGIYTPDEGEVVVNGRSVRYKSPRDAIRDGVAIIAQEFSLVPQMRVIDNVFLGREPAHLTIVNRGALQEEYRATCERAGFWVPPHVSVGALSVADQQRVEILRALARRAELVVMDEPTAALTTDETQKLLEVIRNLRGAGTTVIFVSHFLEDVLRVCDTITVFRNGRVVATTPAADESPPSLVRAMTGRDADLVFPHREPVPPDAPVALEARNLGRAHVVHNISFTVHAGEILGVGGLIGAGRTEMARLLFGVDRATEGTIAVDGRPVRIGSPRDAMRAGLAMVPESRRDQGLFMLRGIVDNISLAHLGEVSRFGVVDRRMEQRRAGELIGTMAIRAADPRAPVWTLSGGNQQKTLFGKWLFSPPRVLLADEPTRGVDVGAKFSIYELIATLARQGMAVILISSELEELMGLAHRIVVMRAGTLVGEFLGPDFDRDALMAAAFGAIENDREAGL